MIEVERAIYVFAKEFLTAGLLMQDLDLSFKLSSPAGQVLDHLESENFDCFVFAIEETTSDNRQYQTLRYVDRQHLKSAIENDPRKRQGELKQVTTTWWFPSERIVGPETSLGSCAEQMNDTRVPLLVRTAMEEPGWSIITRADFASAAGVAATLSLIALVDAALARIIHTSLKPDQVEATLGKRRWRHVTNEFGNAKRRDQEVHVVDYLGFDDRLRVYGDRFGELSKDQRQKLNGARNKLMHGRLDKITPERMIKTYLLTDELLHTIESAAKVGPSERQG